MLFDLWNKNDKESILNYNKGQITNAKKGSEIKSVSWTINGYWELFWRK